MNLRTRFTFNRVGQGLFYDGKIGTFAFIYDCGSQWRKYISQAVSDYRANLGSARIDLAVISHFDHDHISGFDDLLRGLGIDFAVLPYVSPVERLILAISNPGLDPWLYRFWADPLAYLIEERGVKSVVMIGGSSEESFEDHPPDIPRREGNEFPRIDLTSFRMPEDLQTTEEIKQNDSNWTKYLDDKRLTIKNHNGYLNTSGIWQFRFFANAPDRKDLEDFTNCARAALQISDDSFSGDRVKQIITEKTKMESLNDCYQKLFHQKQAMNLASLVMHHGPTKTKHLRDRYISGEGDYLNWLPRAYRVFGPARRFGHLLTGDTVLSKTWTGISIHFSAELHTTSGILIPHHGSIHNWDPRLLGATDYPPIWFVSAGVGNTYGHPSAEVLDSILQCGQSIRWSHQYSQVFESFEYEPA